MNMQHYTIGQSASMTKAFSKEDVEAFSKLSSDYNPIHINEGYAVKSIFKKNIVHGFLVGSLISAVLGTKLPGIGTLYLHQSMNFLKPAFIDELITATATITKIRTDKPIITLETICVNSKGERIIEGEAVVKLLC